jgi:hypothetical protein
MNKPKKVALSKHRRKKTKLKAKIKVSLANKKTTA